MGELIKIQREEKPASIICPKCHSQFNIDITPFANDVTKIMKDNCPKCGVVLFTGLLILNHPDMNGLLYCINEVITALNPKAQQLGNRTIIKP